MQLTESAHGASSPLPSHTLPLRQRSSQQTSVPMCAKPMERSGKWDTCVWHAAESATFVQNWRLWAGASALCGSAARPGCVRVRPGYVTHWTGWECSAPAASCSVVDESRSSLAARCVCFYQIVCLSVCAARADLLIDHVFIGLLLQCFLARAALLKQAALQHARHWAVLLAQSAARRISAPAGSTGSEEGDPTDTRQHPTETRQNSVGCLSGVCRVFVGCFFVGCLSGRGRLAAGEPHLSLTHSKAFTLTKKAHAASHTHTHTSAIAHTHTSNFIHSQTRTTTHLCQTGTLSNIRLSSCGLYSCPERRGS